MIGEWLVGITIIVITIMLSITFLYFLAKELKDSLRDGNYTLVILIISVFLLLFGAILMSLGI